MPVVAGARTQFFQKRLNDVESTIVECDFAPLRSFALSDAKRDEAINQLSRREALEVICLHGFSTPFLRIA